MTCCGSWILYGKPKGNDLLDSAYLYSMCDAVKITEATGVPTEDEETLCDLNREQYALWAKCGARRSTVKRKERNGFIGRPLMSKALKNGSIRGTLKGDAAAYTVNVAGEQEVKINSKVDTSLALDDAYAELLKEKIRGHLSTAFEDCGVSVKGKNSETAIEPFVEWFTDMDGVDKRRVEASILADLAADKDGVVGKVLADFADRVKHMEDTRDRNEYGISEFTPYTPCEKRFRPKDTDAATRRALQLITLAPDLLRTHLYGNPTTCLNNVTEQKFEDEFMASVSRLENTPLLSWFRNDTRLDTFGTSFSLGYMKLDGKVATEQMFPDYMLLLRDTDGNPVPVAIEVKGTDGNKPTDRGDRDRLDAKARCLLQQTSDDPQYGSRTDDTRDYDGKTIAGKGTVIGALVYRVKGVWRVYGNGSEEELSLWLRNQGIDFPAAP